MKLTFQEWQKLTRQEQREAIINFMEPDSIYRRKDYSVSKEEKI